MHHGTQTGRRRYAGLFLAGLVALAGLSAAPASAQQKGAASGLPIPRFVALKSDRVNVRQGPGRDYGVEWIYTRAGLPVEVIAEFSNWRRVRGADGEDGWIFHSLLSGRRTALVTPWDAASEPLDMYRRSDETSPVVARLSPGVQVEIAYCDGTWCEVMARDIEGWIAQDSLWGVYSGELVED